MTNTDFNASDGLSRNPGDSGSTKDSAKEMASSAMHTVKEEVATFAASAKDKARDQVEQRTQAASQTLGDFATAIRKAGDELAQNDQSLAGRVVRQAAEGLEGLSRSVSGKRPEELLDAVRDFGRRNPAAFIAGSVLVGLAIGRFARSSERHQGGERSVGFADEPTYAEAWPEPSYGAAGAAAGGASGEGYAATSPDPVDGSLYGEADLAGDPRLNEED